MVHRPDRRGILTGATAAGICALAPIGFYAAIETRQVEAQENVKLKPGQFRWRPERSRDGPVAIVVSIPDQLVHVYRNGIRIGLSTCSTGKRGHRTPTGVFTILQKDKHHRSSTYNNAPMPNMNRLTWRGIALHAGNLPGYPASHGCIRLPLKFSEHVFSVTHIGTAVIIADDHSEPGFITHSGPVLSALAEDGMEMAVARLAVKKLPPKRRVKDMDHAVSILISSADRELYIIRDGHILTKGPIDIDRPRVPLGSHVYVLIGSRDKGGLHWKTIGYTRSGARLVDTDVSIIRRIKAPPALAQKVADLMHPGLVFVLTDQPAHPETRSDRDFVVVTQHTS